MRPFRCIYTGPNPSPADLARALQVLHDQLWNALDHKIDGYNVAPSALGPGLVMSNDNPPKILNQLYPVPLPPTPNPPPPNPPPPPPQGPTTPGVVLKPNGGIGSVPPGWNTYQGVEIWVKGGTPQGKLCVVDASDVQQPKRQLFSVIPDASTGANPGSEIQTPLGAMTLNTGGAFDQIFKLNGTELVRFQQSTARVGIGENNPTEKLQVDGNILALGGKVASSQAESNGQILFEGQAATDPFFKVILNYDAGNITLRTLNGAGHANPFDMILADDQGATVSTVKSAGQGATYALTHDFSSATTLKVGNLVVNKTTQTASNGGTYSIAATITTVFVDASALTAGQNYNVQLPSAVTYAGREIAIKIAKKGAATSTVTITSAAGNVDGAASKALAGDVYAGAILQSNGTDWFMMGQIGIA